MTDTNKIMGVDYSDGVDETLINSLKEQLGDDLVNVTLPDYLTPEMIENAMPVGEAPTQEDTIKLQEQVETVKEITNGLEAYQKTIEMIGKLNAQLEKISDMNNVIIEQGHRLDPNNMVVDTDNKPLNELMGELKETVAKMHEEVANVPEIDHGEVDNAQRVYSFVVGKQLMLYGVLYETVKIFPVAIELKKTDLNRSHLKLKAGEDVRIYGLPYKVLSVGPGNKLKIENKDYSKV